MHDLNQSNMGKTSLGGCKHISIIGEVYINDPFPTVIIEDFTHTIFFLVLIIGLLVITYIQI